MKIKNKILIVMLLTLLYRILGFLREIVIANNFGVNEITDAYFLANSIPAIIIEIFAVGAMSSAIIPILIPDLKQKAILKNNIEIFLGNFFIMSLIIFFILNLLNKNIIVNIAPGFTESSKNLTYFFTKILYLTVPLLIINELINSVLNCYYLSNCISFYHVIYNFIVLFIGMIFSKKYGIVVFVYGILLATLLRLILSYIKLVQNIGIVKIRIDFKNKKFIEVIKLLYPIMLASISVQINYVIDRLIGSKIGEGSVTYLTYSNKLIQLPLGIILGSVVLTLFPVLVSYIKNGENKKSQKFIEDKIELILLLMGFITIITCIFSDWIVSIVFQRGLFTITKVIETSKILSFYAFSIILVSYITFFQKIFYAFKKTKIPAFINLIVVILNIIFSVFLSRIMGLSGIALGTILANLINAIILFVILKRKIVFKTDSFSVLKLVSFNLILFFIGLKIKMKITYFFEVPLLLRITIFFIGTIVLLFIYLILIYLFYPYKKFYENMKTKEKKC